MYIHVYERERHRERIYSQQFFKASSALVLHSCKLAVADTPTPGVDSSPDHGHPSPQPNPPSGGFQKIGALKQTPNRRALIISTPKKCTPNLWKQPSVLEGDQDVVRLQVPKYNLQSSQGLCPTAPYYEPLILNPCEASITPLRTTFKMGVHS